MALLTERCSESLFKKRRDVFRCRGSCVGLFSAVLDDVREFSAVDIT
jgi:hypothetical protein